MRSCVVMLVWVMLPTMAAAQVQRSSGGSQLQQQVQQLASDRTRLQAENAELKTQLAELRRERDALAAAQASVERRARGQQALAERAGSDRERVEAELQQSRARMEELVGKFRETAGQLREVETQRAALAQSLSGREGELQTCVDRNLRLYDINDEILVRLRKSGRSWSPVEPFTQLKRAEMDNLIEDYRARVDEQRASGAR